MNLFAYGTLMWPEVLESVIGRHLEGRPAMLPGYLRLRIKDEHYPAIIPKAGEQVDGRIYTGLSGTEFDHLDRFEGEEYDRMTVAVGADDAEVYVLAGRCRHLAEQTPWLPEDLRPDYLAAFCREYKGWRHV